MNPKLVRNIILCIFLGAALGTIGYEAHKGYEIRHIQNMLRDNPNDRLTRLNQEVASKLGVKPLKVWFSDSTTIANIGKTSTFFGLITTVDIQFRKKVFQKLTEEEASAVLAHEYGHYALGHLDEDGGSFIQGEYAADIYAYEHGYACGLASFFFPYAAATDFHTKDDPKHSHPAFANRLMEALKWCK